MTPESWLLILLLSNGQVVSHTYSSLTRCETAGRYAVSLPTTHHHTILQDFWCIPSDYIDPEQKDRLQ